MSDLQFKIKKFIISFVSLLPKHMDKWRITLQESFKPVQGLANLAEQLRSIEKANLKHVENFENVQAGVQYKIVQCIEEEISIIKELIEQLNKINQELKNKLTLLEHSTIDLDWDDKMPLIKGSATQPPLSVILQGGLQYWTFFSNVWRNMNESFKNMNVRKEVSMKQLENAFKVDLDNRECNYFIALIQYINKENAIS